MDDLRQPQARPFSASGEYELRLLLNETLARVDGLEDRVKALEGAWRPWAEVGGRLEALEAGSLAQARAALPLRGVGEGEGPPACPRAAGLSPRPPDLIRGSKPWAAEGVSRTEWYRRNLGGKGARG